MLRDRNDLKFLTGYADDIPDSLAHQKTSLPGIQRK